MDIVILAGGKGTRLGLKSKPKPLALINGKSVIEYQLDSAEKYNFKRIYIMLGYMGNQIKKIVNDRYKKSFEIIYFTEKKPLGTAGALYQLKNTLKKKFLVFYADTIFNINLKKLILFDSKRSSEGCLVCHPNDHPNDSDLIEFDFSKRIVKIHPYPHINKYYANNVNAAMYILSPKVFEYIDPKKKSDLAKHVFPKMILKETLIAYKTVEFIKDVGTKNRISMLRKILRKKDGLEASLPIKKNAIFLDRDGVINEEKNNLSSLDEVELIDGSANAIKILNQKNYLVIIVTNQPQISKGFIDEKQLRLIHNKLEYLLGQCGAYVDDIFYCPHHPEYGFENEIRSLKIKCKCRKPEPGMILEAKSMYKINIKKSWLIGDRYRDIEAGNRAKVKTIMVMTGHAGNDKINFPKTKPNFFHNNLEEAVNYITKG